MITYDTQLILSLSVRGIAVLWSLYLYKKIKDWRMTLLTAMLVLMTVQQSLRLTRTPSELAGLIVSFIALLVTVFVGNLILEHQKDEKHLREINEHLEKRVAERTAALEESNTELKVALTMSKR